MDAHVDAKKILFGVKREQMIYIQFPMPGEPQNKYAEQNRQMYINYENSRYPDGWVPDQPVGWWRFKRKGSSEPVPPPPNVVFVRRGND